MQVLRLPSGVSDLLPGDCGAKRKAEEAVRKIFLSHGYEEVYTPMAEYYDLFLESKTALPSSELCKFIDVDGEILVIRPDMTVPIARLLSSSLKDAPSPYRLSYITEVVRKNSAPMEKEWEFTQAGVELLGVKDVSADAEVILLAVETLLKLGLTEFRIDIGNVNFVKSILLELDLNGSDETLLLKAMADKNIHALHSILEEQNVRQDLKDILEKVTLCFGEIPAVVQSFRELPLTEGARTALKQMEQLYDIAVDAGLSQYLWADFGMVQDLSYYTGMIFKGFLGNLGFPVVSGGRYDHLLEQFGRMLPATGFAIQLSRVFGLVKEVWKKKGKRKQVVIFCETGCRKEAFQYAKKLRELGVIVELDLVSKDIEVLAEKKHPGKTYLYLSKEGETIL